MILNVKNFKIMKRLYFFLSVLAILINGLQPAYAATKTWNQTAGGAWTTPAFWTPNGIPAAGDDVIINTNQWFIIL